MKLENVILQQYPVRCEHASALTVSVQWGCVKPHHTPYVYTHVHTQESCPVPKHPAQAFHFNSILPILHIHCMIIFTSTQWNQTMRLFYECITFIAVVQYVYYIIISTSWYGAIYYAAKLLSLNPGMPPECLLIWRLQWNMFSTEICDSIAHIISQSLWSADTL